MCVVEILVYSHIRAYVFRCWSIRFATGMIERCKVNNNFFFVPIRSINGEHNTHPSPSHMWWVFFQYALIPATSKWALSFSLWKSICWSKLKIALLIEKRVLIGSTVGNFPRLRTNEQGKIFVPISFYRLCDWWILSLNVAACPSRAKWIFPFFLFVETKQIKMNCVVVKSQSFIIQTQTRQRVNSMLLCNLQRADDGKLTQVLIRKINTQRNPLFYY